AHERNQPPGRHAWRFTLVSLRNAFQSGLSPLVANGEANARIAAAILGCFPAETFDSTGLFQSLWMMRLSATASDAQGMISDLLRSSLPPNRRPSENRQRRRI